MYTSFPSIFDSVFSDFDSLMTNPRLSFNEIFPPTNIFYYSNGTAELSFALAGYSKEELSVEVNGNKIIIEATPAPTDEKDGMYYGKQKIRKDAFRRVYSLPTDFYDFEKAKVSYVDGLLEIVVPKKEVQEESKKKLIIE